MKIEVELGDQPLGFIRRQPPETKRALREVLHDVERGKAFAAGDSSSSSSSSSSSFSVFQGFFDYEDEDEEKQKSPASGWKRGMYCQSEMFLLSTFCFSLPIRVYP